MEHTFKPNCYHNSRWSSRSYNRPFFIKRQERKESKDEKHHKYIQGIFSEWSELQISDSREKTPFYKNLYSEIFNNIKSIDRFDDAYSHIITSRNKNYQNSCKNYLKIKELQLSHNQHIENFIDKLKTIINENKSDGINIDNVISYIFGIFLHRHLLKNIDITSEIRDITENCPHLIFRSSEEVNSYIENTVSLLSTEKKVFKQLIEGKLQEIVKQMQNYENRIAEIKTELESFNKNCLKIAYDLETDDLKGECEKEAHFKLRYKLKRKLKSFKYFLRNE